jgi:hypothetical protein
VASDIAFLVMDLESRGLTGAARRVLNAWLEESGDYGALAVMDFYRAYRALVRAKVNLLRLGQEPDEARRGSILAEYRRYAALAACVGQRSPPFVAITCGVSAVGKSRVALAVVEACGAVRVRSDVERKRMLGGQPAELGDQTDAGIYAAAATTATYDRLLALAGDILRAGYPVVLDATFLRQSQRSAAAALAAGRGVPFRILHCTADEAVIRERLARRRAAGGDPSDATEAVVRRQLSSGEALDAAERAVTLAVRTDAPDGTDQLARQLAALCPS